MLHNYQTEEFGHRLRDIRKGLNLTQQDVSDMSGVNLDTLRKLENGYVVPRYDTLEILSITYKIDLLEVFKNYRFTSDLYEIYNMLDKYIVDYQVDKLKKIKDKINSLDEKVYNMMVLASEVTKLKMLIEAIYILNSNNENPDRSELLKAKQILIDALRIFINDFDIEYLEYYKYTYFDIRILVILSVIVVKLKESELSNKILRFILQIADKSSHASFLEKLLVIKIYTNISYNYYRMEDAEETLKYSNEGIEYAHNNHLLYGLSLLYMRKGVAELRLNKEEHIDSFRKCIYSLEIQGNTKLKEIYESVLENKYHIKI